MKKRILLTVLVVSMVAIMAVIFTACDLGLGDIIPSVDGADYETETLSTKEQIESRLGNNYTITMKYGSTSSDSGSGTTGGWSTQSTIKRYNDTTLVIVQDLEEGSIKNQYMTKGDFYYTYDSELNKYTTCTKAFAGIDTGYSLIMGYAGDSIDYNKKSNATATCGRSCTKYVREWSVSAYGASVKYTSTYMVDRATGICLEYSYTGSTSAIGEGSSSGSLSYQVTNFSLGSTDLSSEIAKVAVTEWLNGEDLTNFGLNGIAKPTGTYGGGSIDYYESSVSSFTTMILVDNKAAVNAFCEALYNGGANLDYIAGDVVEDINTLYSINQDEFVNFSSSTSTATVNVSAFVSDNNKFMMTVKFDK